ncbi:hypothetical protein HQ520_14565 [bacterium]|nr:hypothetical protein [bacterium]
MKRWILTALLMAMAVTGYAQTAPENLTGDWWTGQLRDDALYADVVVREVTEMADEVARLRTLSNAQATTITLLRAADDFTAELQALTEENAGLTAQVFALTNERDGLTMENAELRGSLGASQADLDALRADTQAYTDRTTVAADGASAAGQGAAVSANPYPVGYKADWWEFGHWAAMKGIRLTRTLQAVNGLVSDPENEIPPGKLAEIWGAYQ